MSDAPLPEDDEVLAAELALGLIEDGDRPAAEARLTRDPGFRAAHTRWQDHALGLLQARDEPPRPSVWAAIAARLPANDAAPHALATYAAPLRWWQAATAAASIAAVLLGVIAFDRAPPPPTLIERPAPPSAPPPSPPPLVAVLTGKQGAIAVSFDPATAQLTTAPSGVAIGAKAAELWVIPAGRAPRSLGVIAATGNDRKAPPPTLARALVPGATLAVTVEPAGGSPSGLPTGPVILSGVIAA